MKKRVFMEMDNAVFHIIIDTQDWSQDDVKLMAQFGEPEIDVGGRIEYLSDGEPRTKLFGNEYIRVFHGFPYSRGFDSRDYGTDDQSIDERVAEAVAAGRAWKDAIIERIDSAVMSMRAMSAPLPTEEVSQI